MPRVILVFLQRGCVMKLFTLLSD